jgi:hypothetical protein
MTTWKRSLVATGVLGIILAGSVVITPKRLLADVKTALVRDEDSPGRNAFQATFTMTGSLLGGTIPIPAGKRLVVDFIEAHGGATTNGPSIQPTVVLNSSLNGSPSVAYYFPLQVEASGINQFTQTEKVAVYADSLNVGMAYSGYSPVEFIFVANVSGHYIDIP